MGSAAFVPKRSNAGDVLFGAARQAVLRLLYGHPCRRFYQREIIRLAGVGSGAVQRELEQLSVAGILGRTVEGRQTYYQANERCPVFLELRSLIRKSFGVADVLREALSAVGKPVDLAFIHGSVAGGTENEASDIDLMVVGPSLTLHAVVAALAGAQRELGREVTPSVYQTSEFCRKLAAGHHFLSSVVAGEKIFLIGGPSELAKLARIRMAQGAQAEPAGNRRSSPGRR